MELFYSVIDMQIQELNDHFTEANTELLLRVACLCSNDSFFTFNKKKLVELAKCYLEDFSTMELMVLDDQLETYIFDMQQNKDFSRLKGIGDLARKMVEKKKHKVYTLVDRLLTLALILPVATSTMREHFLL